MYVDEKCYEEFKLQVLVKAKEIYEQLKKQRKAKGLGEFDNDISDSVRNLL